MLPTPLTSGNCNAVRPQSDACSGSPHRWQPPTASSPRCIGDFAAAIGARSAELGASSSGYKHVGNAADGHPTTALDLFAYPMIRLLVAARAFGLRAIDGPCGAFRDTSATAAKAAAMGFDGKQVIHPTQIEATRNAFIPSDVELAYAQRVIAAMEEAERDGQAAVTVDGKMVDYANLRMIRRLMSFKGQVS